MHLHYIRVSRLAYTLLAPEVSGDSTPMDLSMNRDLGAVYFVGSNLVRRPSPTTKKKKINIPLFLPRQARSLRVVIAIAIVIVIVTMIRNKTFKFLIVYTLKCRHCSCNAKKSETRSAFCLRACIDAPSGLHVHVISLSLSSSRSNFTFSTNDSHVTLCSFIPVKESS